MHIGSRGCLGRGCLSSGWSRQGSWLFSSGLPPSSDRLSGVAECHCEAFVFDYAVRLWELAWRREQKGRAREALHCRVRERGNGDHEAEDPSSWPPLPGAPTPSQNHRQPPAPSRFLWAWDSAADGLERAVSHVSCANFKSTCVHAPRRAKISDSSLRHP